MLLVPARKGMSVCLSVMPADGVVAAYSLPRRLGTSRFKAAL
jgi:hypothetical protein